MADLLRSRFRQKRFEKFTAFLGVQAKDRILDIGGMAGTWVGSPFRNQVTLLNLYETPEVPEGMSYVKGDACDLSFLPDGAYDIVFSNSVIEHVGDFSRQALMAKEVRRVGRKYWLQTPNKHFPLEVHFLFPGFQYLPMNARRVVARFWPLSFAKLLKFDAVREAEHLWPLGARQMRLLFPDAVLLRERFCGLTKSLIVARR